MANYTLRPHYDLTTKEFAHRLCEIIAGRGTQPTPKPGDDEAWDVTGLNNHILRPKGPHRTFGLSCRQPLADGLQAFFAEEFGMTPQAMASARPETGPMQFGCDWPGVFIRGDNAMAFMLALDTLMRNPNDAFAQIQVQGLRDALMGCDDRLLRKGGTPEAEPIQMLKPWDDCQVPDTEEESDAPVG